MLEESVRGNLDKLQYNIRELTDRPVRIIAVTKTHAESIFDLCLKLQLTHVGENRIQELIQKNEANTGIRNKLTIHFIGPMQTNKVKFLSENADTLDTLSSEEVLEKINQRWEIAQPLKVLLQINCTDEKQKSGLHYKDKTSILKLAKLCIADTKIRLEGLMTMGPTPSQNYDEDNAQYINDTRIAFKRLKSLSLELENDLSVSLPRLSMGMSHDYKLAIECGSTEIRIGSLLFGSR
jgi:pyridoxal phosphate enzyme (YggS family)